MRMRHFWHRPAMLMLCRRPAQAQQGAWSRKCPSGAQAVDDATRTIFLSRAAFGAIDSAGQSAPR
jgi:hypothetical protein